MIKKSFISLIIIATLISLIVLPLPVKAQAPIAIFVFDGNENSSFMALANVHPSADVANSAVGNIFIANKTGYLASAQFELYESSGCDLTFRAYLTGVTGDIATNDAYPNSTIFAKSITTIDSSECVPSGFQIFYFNQTYQLIEGQVYACYIVAEDGGADTVRVLAYYNSVEQPYSLMIQYNSNQWLYGHSFYNNYNGTYSMKVYGVAESAYPSPTPTPTPSPTPTPTATPTATPTPSTTSAQLPETMNIQPFWQYLYAGNLWGFLQGIFSLSFILQDILYGVIIMLFIGPVYIRTRSLLLVAVIWILLGSFFIAAMPAVSGLAIIFLILGVGSVLYKLVRPN